MEGGKKRKGCGGEKEDDEMAVMGSFGEEMGG